MLTRPPTKATGAISWRRGAPSNPAPSRSRQQASFASGGADGRAEIEGQNSYGCRRARPCASPSADGRTPAPRADFVVITAQRSTRQRAATARGARHDMGLSNSDRPNGAHGRGLAKARDGLPPAELAGPGGVPMGLAPHQDPRPQGPGAGPQLTPRKKIVSSHPMDRALAGSRLLGRSAGSNPFKGRKPRRLPPEVSAMPTYLRRPESEAVRGAEERRLALPGGGGARRLADCRAAAGAAGGQCHRRARTLRSPGRRASARGSEGRRAGHRPPSGAGGTGLQHGTQAESAPTTTSRRGRARDTHAAQRQTSATATGYGGRPRTRGGKLYMNSGFGWSPRSNKPPPARRLAHSTEQPIHRATPTVVGGGSWQWRWGQLPC